MEQLKMKLNEKLAERIATDNGQDLVILLTVDTDKQQIQTIGYGATPGQQAYAGQLARDMGFFAGGHGQGFAGIVRELARIALAFEKTALTVEAAKQEYEQ